MKRLIILITVVGAVALGTIMAGTFTDIRMAGTAGRSYDFVGDSLDTAYFDTFYSDTLTNLMSKDVINIALVLDGFTLGDSIVSDSVVYIVQTIKAFTGGLGEQIIYTDTFGALGVLDSTAAWTEHHFKTDTMAYQEMYFRTIIEDSVINADDNPGDTSTFRFKIYVLDR